MLKPKPQEHPHKAPIIDNNKLAKQTMELDRRTIMENIEKKAEKNNVFDMERPGAASKLSVQTALKTCLLTQLVFIQLLLLRFVIYF